MLGSGDPVEVLAEWLREAAGLAVAFTGAGVSADSGVPTFRGPGGLWQKYKPEELASPEGFRRDPALVWRWYAWRMGLIKKARPNAAHIVLARLEEMGLLMGVVTQNVDGLHQRAGSKRVVELHGNIWRARCTVCGYRWVLTNPPGDDEVPVKCPMCGGLARPDVVWFGESLPEAALSEAIELMEHAALVIVVGTSGVVEPAGSLPLLALRSGARLVNVNPEPNRYTGIAHLDVRERADPFFRRLAGVMGILLGQA